MSLSHVDHAFVDSQVCNEASRTNRVAFRSTEMRNNNLTLIANTIVNSSQPLSRADLARQTGLNRSTMTRLVEQLIECGIIRELHQSHQGTGRPAVPLVPAQHTHAAIGVDISPGLIEAVVVDLSGETLAQYVQQTNTQDPTSTLGLMRQIIDNLRNRACASKLNITGATIAIRGLLSPSHLHLLNSPNLGWSDVDLHSVLQHNSSHPIDVSFLNAADAGAYAESYQRNKQGQPLHDYLYISGGIGIDAAIIRNNVFDDGCHGWAGELGHIFTESGERICSCGNTGCLETFAGQSALIQGSGFDIDAPVGNLFAALARKEPDATETIHTAARCMGIAISAFINICDISNIVIDGLYAQLFSYIEDTLRQVLEKHVLSSRWAEISVLKSANTSNSAAFGAGWFRLSQYLTNPALWTKQTEERLNYYPIQETPEITI